MQRYAQSAAEALRSVAAAAGDTAGQRS